MSLNSHHVPIDISPHAAMRMRQRGIPQAVVTEAVHAPFIRRPAPEGRLIHEVSGIVDDVHTWVRVVLDTGLASTVVVTAYPLTSCAQAAKASIDNREAVASGH